MSDKRLIRVEFGPIGPYDTLLVPPWVRNPTALPRQDGGEKLLVVVDRRFSEEQWQILPLSDSDRPGRLYAFRLLTGGESYGDPRDVQLAVHIPLEFFAHFKIQNLK